MSEFENYITQKVQRTPWGSLSQDEIAFIEERRRIRELEAQQLESDTIAKARAHPTFGREYGEQAEVSSHIPKPEGVTKFLDDAATAFDVMAPMSTMGQLTKGKLNPARVAHKGMETFAKAMVPMAEANVDIGRNVAAALGISEESEEFLRQRVESGNLPQSMSKAGIEPSPQEEFAGTMAGLMPLFMTGPQTGLGAGMGSMFAGGAKQGLGALAKAAGGEVVLGTNVELMNQGLGLRDEGINVKELVINALADATLGSVMHGAVGAFGRMSPEMRGESILGLSEQSGMPPELVEKIVKTMSEETAKVPEADVMELPPTPGTPARVPADVPPPRILPELPEPGTAPKVKAPPEAVSTLRDLVAKEEAKLAEAKTPPPKVKPEPEVGGETRTYKGDYIRTDEAPRRHAYEAESGAYQGELPETTAVRSEVGDITISKADDVSFEKELARAREANDLRVERVDADGIVRELWIRGKDGKTLVKVYGDKRKIDTGFHEKSGMPKQIKRGRFLINIVETEGTAGTVNAGTFDIHIDPRMKKITTEAEFNAILDHEVGHLMYQLDARNTKDVLVQDLLDSGFNIRSIYGDDLANALQKSRDAGIALKGQKLSRYDVKPDLLEEGAADLLYAEVKNPQKVRDAITKWLDNIDFSDKKIHSDAIDRIVKHYLSSGIVNESAEGIKFGEKLVLAQELRDAIRRNTFPLDPKLEFKKTHPHLVETYVKGRKQITERRFVVQTPEGPALGKFSREKLDAMHKANELRYQQPDTGLGLGGKRYTFLGDNIKPDVIEPIGPIKGIEPGIAPKSRSGASSQVRGRRIFDDALALAEDGDPFGAIKLLDKLWEKKLTKKFPEDGKVRQAQNYMEKWYKQLNEDDQLTIREMTSWTRRGKNLDWAIKHKNLEEIIEVDPAVTEYKSGIAQRETRADQASGSAFRTVGGRLRLLGEDLGTETANRVFRSLERARDGMERRIGTFLTSKGFGIWDIVKDYSPRAQAMLNGKMWAGIRMRNVKLGDAKIKVKDFNKHLTNSLFGQDAKVPQEIQAIKTRIMGTLERMHNFVQQADKDVVDMDMLRTLLRETPDNPVGALEAYVQNVWRDASKFDLDNKSNPMSFYVQIRKLHKEAKAKKLHDLDTLFVEKLQGALEDRNPVASIISSAQAAMSISKLPFVALTNVAQINHSASRLGVLNTIEAMYNMTVGTAKGAQIRTKAFQAGNALESILDESLAVLLSGTQELGKGANYHARTQAAAKTIVGNWYGLKPMERYLRTMSDYAGRRSGLDSAVRLKKSNITVEQFGKLITERPGFFKGNKLNIGAARQMLDLAGGDVKIAKDLYSNFLSKGGFTTTQADIMARNAIKMTQFRVGVQDLPIAMSGQMSVFMKLVTQFKTFSYKHGEMMTHVAKEFANGNQVPLMKLMVVAGLGAQVTGTITEEIKSLVSGKKIKGGSVIGNMISYVTGRITREEHIDRMKKDGIFDFERVTAERAMHNIMAWGGLGLQWDAAVALFGRSDARAMSFLLGPALSTGLEGASHLVSIFAELAMGGEHLAKRAREGAGFALEQIPAIGRELGGRVALEEPEVRAPGALEHLGVLPSLEEARSERRLRGEIAEQRADLGLKRERNKPTPAEREMGRRERVESAYEKDLERVRILEAFEQGGEPAAYQEYMNQKYERGARGPKAPKEYDMLPARIRNIIDQYRIER